MEEGTCDGAAALLDLEDSLERARREIQAIVIASDFLPYLVLFPGAGGWLSGRRLGNRGLDEARAIAEGAAMTYKSKLAIVKVVLVVLEGLLAAFLTVALAFLAGLPERSAASHVLALMVFFLVTGWTFMAWLKYRKGQAGR